MTDLLWRERDIDAALALVHPDADIDFSDSRAPYRGHYRGHREIRNLFQAMAEAWDRFYPEFREMPATRLSGVSAGLHTLALIPPDTDEAALVAAAANEGIVVRGLATARFDPEAGPPGLIIGTATSQPRASRKISKN
jgi:DNA-binding transcriptional MocR family regulator